jgi:CheY-like chemotaxis protein/CHASE3 domain sensor protein/putative methionine-R-sulfoxide reductase with GAF domain
MKFTLGKKILTGFIICSLILIVLAWISFENSEKLIASNQWVVHTQEVLYALEQTQAASIAAETAERGYIITGDENFLAPLKEAKSHLFELIDKVKELTRDNPGQQAYPKEIEGPAADLISFLDKCILVRKTEGFAKAQQLVATEIGENTLNKIRDITNNAKSAELKLLSERKLGSEADTRNSNSVFVILLSVIGIVLITVYFIITSNLGLLKRIGQEATDKNWTLTGSGELIKKMQGDKQVGELAESIINHLAAWLNAGIGAIYIAEEDDRTLKLVAAYAIDKDRRKSVPFRFGEGLAGQAAAEKRLIRISDIPSDYLKIQTGFGDVQLKEVLAIPFVFEGVVRGVIELGHVREFTALEQAYLETIADSIAVAVALSQARIKSKELLEETQRQSEDLETRQQELKQSNEELHAKTDLLENSESELNIQQVELQQINEELKGKANLLAEQKNKLEMAKTEVEIKARELELSGRYKSEFLANMSHELRTPLNSILILAQLLAENKKGSIAEKEVEFARNIHSSGIDLLNLINEILDLSKVEAGKMELEISRVNIDEVVANLRSMFTGIADKKSIELKINFAGQKPGNELYSDQQRLVQILRNLLSNAFKFTGPNGKVTVDIDAGPDGKASFAVTDTGIGVPENKQGVIFEAFQQADGSTKRKYGGTGLGLSISRELARALGGEIRLHSEEGKGSRFTYSCPLLFDLLMPAPQGKEEVIGKVALADTVQKNDPEAEDDLMEAELDDRHTIQGNDRIMLIIEDDPTFAGILLHFFREKGYKGIMAHQGNTGLSLARHYRPDAIFLDMHLPVMSGSEVLKQLKNDPELRHIPVQIFSGYDLRKDSLELGAFDFVKKPVTMEGMEDAVNKIEEFIHRKLKKLLIVEDNKQQNLAIRELIGNGDVKSFSAYAGLEAYELLQKEKFDCIIIDLGLPDMTGMELLEKIRASEELNKIPIIVYTGKDLGKDEVTSLNRLANTIVLKTADSKERLLDEVILFLHRMESKLPKEKQQIIRKLHRSDEVLQNRKVLIVDDDIRNIYSLTNALEEQGLCCITAENGRAAIGMLKKHSDTDIVLMDVMMPEMDGYESTQAIRKMEGFIKLPVIALTAKAMKGDRERCLEAGMSDYVAKPVNIEQLLSLMRVWLYK